MRVDTDRVIRAARADKDLRTAINTFRRRLRREAISFAVDALYDWVARGVETYHANRGWIFLLDNNNALRSIPGAAVRCPKQPISVPYRFRDRSFMWRVLQGKKGDFSNDVSKLLDRFIWCDERTQSELAVPLFDEDGVEGGKVLGVYNLEADEKNVFFPEQVRELQRNVSLLTVHLLVLRDWYQRSPDSDPWVWHPDPHGWNPDKLMRRFCRAVVRGAKPGGERQPVCSIWNADPEHSWCLATSGLDYEFQAQRMLPSHAATAEVAAGSAQGIRRGTPQELRVYNLDKLMHIGVTYGYIAALQRPEASVRGTFNLYAVDKATALPPEEGVKWLARQAEDLLATANRQRETFAKAYVHGQMTKSATTVPSAVIFRRSVMRALPADAMTTFIPAEINPRETVDGPVRLLKAFDTTGFMDPEGNPVWAGASFPVLGGGRREESLTAWCYVHAGLPVRLNVPSDRTSGRYADLPVPSTSYPELMVYGDADTVNRRRLGVAVKAPMDGSGVVGVIRMYRSSKGRPFTEADAKLLDAIANSEKCRILFSRWGRDPGNGPDPGPDFPPLPTMLESDLRKAMKQIGEEASAGRVYLLQGQAYEEYVCHPQHELPRRTLRIGPQHNPTRGVTGGPDASQRVQSWVKLFSWAGAYLSRAVVAYEFRDEPTARGHAAQVYKAALTIAATLSENNWNPPQSVFNLDSDDLEPILSSYTDYVRDADRIDIERCHRSDWKADEDASDSADLPPLALTPTIVKAQLLSDHQCLNLPWPLGQCPDPDLAEYGVRITSDGAHCVVPLRLADLPYTNLVCDIHNDHAAELDRSMAAARSCQPPDMPVVVPTVEDEWIWRRLRHNVGLVVGAWSRMAARFVDFKLSQ